MKDFLKKVAEILEIEMLNETDKLDEFLEWDSLARLSVVAMLDAHYGVILGPNKIMQIKTAGDLWNLVQSKKCT